MARFIRRRPRFRRAAPKRKRSFRRRRFSRPMKRGRGFAKNIARSVESYEVLDQAGGTSLLRAVQLNGTAFPRSALIAENYRWYRLEKVEYEYRPKFDTYQEGSGPTIPWLWTLRAKYAPTSGVDPLQGAGVLPALQECSAFERRFNKRIVVKYKPNTLQLTQYAASGLAGSQTVSPTWNKWYPTMTPAGGSPGVVPELYWYGHYDYMEQRNKETPPLAYDLIVRATWAFKEPALPNTS